MVYVFRLYLYSMRTIKGNQFFVWEENDSTAPTMKSENSGITALKNTTNEIKNVSVENVCEDIGSRKEWKRNCPKCGNVIEYNNKYALEKSINGEKWCFKCRCLRRKKRISYERSSSDSLFKKNCPKCFKELYYKNKYNLEKSIKNNSLCDICEGVKKFRNLTDEEKLIRNKKLSEKLSGINHPQWGKSHTDEYKKHLKEINLGDNNPMYGKIGPNKGKKFSDSARHKLRISVINRLKKMGILFGQKGANNFNPRACEYIDNLNKEKGWNLQHALNGGEIEVCGYFVDGYDKDRNIVIEYDEKYHRYQKEKDIKRMNEIKNHLQCKFLRYDGYIGELKEY